MELTHWWIFNISHDNHKLLTYILFLFGIVCYMGYEIIRIIIEYSCVSKQTKGTNFVMDQKIEKECNWVPQFGNNIPHGPTDSPDHKVKYH